VEIFLIFAEMMIAPNRLCTMPLTDPFFSARGTTCRFRAAGTDPPHTGGASLGSSKAFRNAAKGSSPGGAAAFAAAGGAGGAAAGCRERSDVSVV